MWKRRHRINDTYRNQVDLGRLVLRGLQRLCVRSGTEGDRLLGPCEAQRLLATQLPHELLHGRGARAAVDEQHRIEVCRAHLGRGDCALAHGQRALEVRGDELLELGAAESKLEVLGPAGVGRDERQRDLGGA